MKPLQSLSGDRDGGILGIPLGREKSSESVAERRAGVTVEAREGIIYGRALSIMDTSRA